MTDPRDYKLDIASVPKPEPAAGEAAQTNRPFVSVHFACCNVYLRIYRSADGQHYRGRCPRCGVAVTFVVGEGGTPARTFTVR